MPEDHNRRDDDRRLFDALARVNFDEESAEWHELLSVLADYGYAVLRQWLMSGSIRQKAAEQGRGGVRGLSRIPTNLTVGRDDAHELAVMTMQQALPRFLRSLADGDWLPEGGASLTTYFTGRCLMVFPDVYERWLKSRQRSDTMLANQLDLEVGRPAFASWADDPAAQATDRIEQQHYLAGLAAEDRAMLELSAAGHTTREIAELFKQADIPLTRSAINTRLSRLRNDLRRRRAQDDRAGEEPDGGGDGDDR